MRYDQRPSPVLAPLLKRVRHSLRQGLALLLVVVTPSSTITTAGAIYPSPRTPNSVGLAHQFKNPLNSPSLGVPVLSSGIRGVHAMPQSESSNGIAVSVGYADNLTPSMNFPTPWQGSPNVAFYGGGATFKAGAIRLDNSTSSPMTVDSVTVDLQRPGPIFNHWTNLTIPANGSAILTQTTSYNFDTGSYPIVSCGGTIPAGDTRIPLITVTQGGTSTSYQDTSHVLDTGGFDLSCRGNSSLAWRPIGTTGIEAPSAGITASPNGSITETGNPVALQAQVLDAAGQALANASVSFSIKSGPNSGMTGQTATSAQGTAQFSYVSLLAGSDSIHAALTNLTGTNLNAAPVLANWTSEGPCPAPTASAPGSTNLIYVGQTSAHVGDTLIAAALLTDGSGNGLSGQTISFTFQNSTATATTDSTGVARTNFPASTVTTAPLGTSFAGATSLSAARTSATVTVAQGNTEIAYAGPTVLTTGSAQQLTATLTDLHHGLPLPNEALTFQVGSTQATALTNANGVATVSLTLPSNPTTGPGQIQVSFAGDTDYLPSYKAAQAIIAVSSAFVIWGGNSRRLHLGQDVNFWGAQWASQLTNGNFSADASFNGFAQYVASFDLCAVPAGSGQQTLDDKCWNTEPGNSNPPATLPPYIEVIVSNAIANQGSEIYGNVASLAVLKVDSTPAYGPDPSHPGYGVVVAVIQDGADVFPTLVTLSATQSQPATVLPGQPYTVNTQVTNSGQTAASNVAVSESFDGTQPPTGSQSDTLIASSGQFTPNFSETVPTYPTRQSNETSSAYETRLAGIDGRRFTSAGTITSTDSVGESYLPLNVSSHSLLQLPRLDVSLHGPACVSPSASVPYVVTITNVGSATATAVAGTLTLPDGSVKSITASNLASGTSSVTTVNFQLAPLAPLALADGTVLTATANVNWQDAQGNNYGTVTEQVSSTTGSIPIVSKTPTAPRTRPLVTSAPAAAIAQTAPASAPVAFQYAMFATAAGCGAINLSGSAYTDAFNSNVAPYSSQHNTTNGSIAAEGNIALSGSASIGGTLYAANTTVGTGCVFSGGKVNQGISSSGSASCSSGHACSHQQITTAAPGSPSVPAITSSGTTVNIAGGTTTLNPNNYNNVNKANSINISGSANVTFPAGAYYIYNLTVSGSSTITLGQGTYYLNSINLSGSSLLYLAMSSGQKGPVTLNIAGSGQGVPINLSGGTIVNQTLIASNLEIFYAGTGGASLSGGANAYFTVDAPSAAITLSGTTAIYGALVGATINDSGGAAVHFDQALSLLAQTITFPNPGTQTYGVAPITLAATASSGLPVTYSVISGPATVAGSKLTITGAGTVTVEADQAGNSSYLPAPPVQQTFAVNKAVLGVTATNAAMTYGRALPTFTATYSGFVNGDTTSVLTGAPSLTTTATSASPAGAYPITAAQGTLAAANYAFTFTNGTLTIGKAVLTVTAQNAAMTYGRALPTFTATYSGFVNGDTTSVLTGAPSLTTTATSASPAGTYPITAAQGTLAAANYTFTFANGTLTIGKAVLTVTAQNATMTYGRTLPTFTATYSGFANGDTVSVLTGAPSLTTTATSASPAGTYPITAAQGTLAAANYTFTFANGTLTIQQAPVAVTLGNLVQTYSGSPEPVSVATVPAGVSVAISYTGINGTAYGPSSTAPTNPGTYTAAATVTNLNFAGGTSATLTINQLNPSLSLALLAGMPEPSPYGTLVYFELTMATAPCPTGQVQFWVDNVASGAPVTLNGTNCSHPIEFSTAGLTPGSHSVYAVYSGDTFYVGQTSGTVTHNVVADATSVTLAASAGSVNVGQTVAFTATVTPSPEDPSAVAPSGTVQFYDGGVLLGSSSLSAAAPYTASFSTAALLAGTHSVTATYVSANGLYSGSSSAVTVETVNKIAPTITWAQPADIVYGTALSSTQLNATATDSGNPVSGTFTYNPAAGTVLPVGTRNLQVTFTPSDSATYVTQSASVTINVKSAVLTVTANNASITYGGTLPTFTATYSGFVNGDTTSVLTGAPSLTTTATSASPAGAYSITAAQGTLSAPNYSFVFVNGTLTITQASQTITFPNPGPQTYPGSPITLVATASSGLAVVYSVISGPATVSGVTLTITGTGSVTIEADQPGNANYAAASPVQQSFTVKPVNAPPIVTAGPNQTVPFPNDYPLKGQVTSANTPPGIPSALWSVVSTNPSGLAVTFTNPTSPTSIVKLNAAGTYVLQLTGTEKGVSASAQVTITAVAGNKPPVVNAGPDQKIELPANTATLTGSATGATPNVTLTYTWSQISGPGTATIANPTSPVTSVTFPTTGTYTFRLNVSDGQLSGIADTHVTEYGLNQPPVVNAGPNQSITLPTNSVTLNGSATDDGLPLGSVLTVNWSVVQGTGTATFANPISPVTTATFSQAGTYHLRLSASDTQYTSTSDTFATVNPPQPPAPGPTLVLSPSAAGPNVVGATQSLTATLKDGGGTPVSGQTVTFTITGPNATTGTATTDTNGSAAFTYTGANNGTDSVQSQTTISGATLLSNTGAVSWITSSGYAPAIDLEPIGADSTLNGGALDGAFTDSSGGLIEAVAIGDTATLVVPIGATQLQLGINDGYFPDNAGSWVVSVNGSPITVPGAAMPWISVQGGLNAAFPYGFQNGSSPAVAATNLTPGQTVTIAYQGGAVSLGPGLFPYVDANGIPNSPSGSLIGYGGKLSATFYMSTLQYSIGERASFTASVTYGSGTLIPNQPVTFTVVGANPQQFQTLTDGTGTAAFTYKGLSGGSDAVQAQTQLNGVSVSRARLVNWVVVPNQAPTVDAGPNQPVTFPDIATLNGTATDDGLPNGTLIINWAVLSGPGTVTFSSPTQAITQVAFSTPGTYVLQLSANDTQYTATSNVTITVNTASQQVQPPSVSAGPSQTVIFPNTATLSGSVTNSALPPGAMLTSVWSVLGGSGTVTFGNATSPVTTASFSATGTYVLQLSASNTQYTTTATTTINVMPGPTTQNQPPSVSAGPSQVIQLPINTATLNGTVTDDGLPVGAPLTQQWSLFSGTSPSSGSGYAFGQVITVDHTKVPNTDQQHFPLLISGTYPFLATVPNGGGVANANGFDIIFTSDAAGTSPLLYERESYNPATGAAVFWVSVPLLSHTTDTTIYLFYGNPAITTDQTNKNGVWDTNYLGVWHLPDGSVLSGAESTANGYSLTNNNGTSATLGQIDGAASFNGSNTYLSNSSLSIPSGSPITISFWNLVSTAQNSAAFSIGGSDNPNRILSHAPWSDGNLYWDYGNTSAGGGPGVSYASHLGSWTYVTLEYNPTGQVHSIYLNGNLATSVVSSSHPVATQTGITIGKWSSYYHNGSIDEFRVSTTVRSADWTATEYNNQSSPATFYSIAGGHVTFSSPNQPVTQATFAAAGTYVLQLSASDTQYTTTSNVTVTVYPASQQSQPPVVSAGPSQTVIFPNTVTLSGSVTDGLLPPGAMLTSVWSVLGGPGTVTFGNATSPVTTASFSATGTYLLQLSASNTQYTSTATTTITIMPAIVTQNQPPSVSASALSPVTLPNAVALNGTATDDGLPNHTLTVLWTALIGPGTVTFANATSANTTATFSAAGTYMLQLSASDTQYTSSATLTIVVVNAPSSGAQNQPPVLSAGPSQSITLPVNSVTLHGLATDDGLPYGTLSIAWTEVSGPAPVTFGNSAAAQTSATFSAAGVYLLQLGANDGQYSTTAQTTVSVTSQSSSGGGGGPQNQPPTVNVGPAQTIFLPSNTVTLNGSVSDDGLPSNTSIISWSQVSGPGTVTFSNASQAATQATFPAAGIYVLQLSANDTQLTTTAQVAITVNAQPGPPPSVLITAPTDGTEVTMPASVTGTVSNGNWVLQYAQLIPDNATAQQWTTFASGSGAVTGALGTFDPTILLNGEYSIRLTSTDASGQYAYGSISVYVDRNVKVGVFSLAFNDLSVPVSGFPIQITRSYDSRDKSNGDFGVGWRLAIANARVQKNHIPGLAWQNTVTFSGQLPQYCVQPTIATTVTVTFPDGKVYSFQTSLAQTCQLAAPITADTVTFVQLPGAASTAGATLVPSDGGAILVEGDVPGPGSLYDYNGNIYNSTAFTLTTAQGVTYTIDQTHGVTSIKDLNGNSLTISATSVTSSAGKSVAINRDGQGRVTSITDPNGVSLLYNYDASGNLGSFTDRAANMTKFGYDANHNLTGITLPNGQSGLANAYDASGRLTGTTDGAGISTTFTHNVAAQTETVTDRNGNPTTYIYDADGNIVQSTDALGHLSSATYDSSDNKLSETNTLGKTSTYTYDVFGNRLSESDPLHHQSAYTYSPLQQVLTVADPLSHATTNTYDTNGNLLTTKDPLGNVTTNSYSPNGLLASTKDALQNTTSFGYDASGNMTSQTDANGTVTGYSYDANGNRLTQSVTRTLPASQGGGTQTLATQFAYDGNNRLTKTTYPDGSFTQTQYNSLGQQSATIDAKGNTTSYTYDADGRLTQTKYADNTTESTTYDANGNRLTSTDRAGNITKSSYDALNRLTTTTFADTNTASSTYDAIGEVLTSKDANGNVTTYAYDDAGRRTSVTDALTHATSFGYDNAGNQTSVTDALMHTTAYTYDAGNRRTQVAYPDGKQETTGYDALGRVASRTDANGKVTAYAYDALGRLASVTQDASSPSNPGGLNLLTKYTYDEVGNRLTQTDANNHTTGYQYDRRGRRTARALPLGPSEAYAYDANGNLSTRTDFNGRTTAYTYDTMNRLLSKAADPYFVTNHIGAASVSYTYEPTGQRATMADASGTTTYSYDTRNRLTSEATPEGTLGYTYDAASDVKSIQSSNAGGASMAYGYDALNRLSSVTDANGPSSYGYDNVGNLQTVTYPNGVAHSYSYDTRNRLTTLGVTGTVSGAPGTIASYAYTVDAAGHRTAVSELSGRKVSYSYDSIYRLTNETITSDPNAMNGAVSYAYDAVGNRLQKTSTLPGFPGASSTYNANDELATDAYDADGNTVGSGVNTGTNGYVYDFENHLVQQAGIAIVYDGDGKRVSKSTANATTQYLVDDLNPTGYAQMMDELQSSAVSRTYTWGLELISEHQTLNSTPTTSYYVFDGHGSTRALTNAAGAITDTYDYDAFGTELHSTGTTLNNFLSAGEQFDPDLNLYYNQARYLNTGTGRFWSFDTDEGQDEEPLTLHKYLYADGDPVDGTDPSGNQDSMAELSVEESIGTTLNTALTILRTVVTGVKRVLPYQVVVVTPSSGAAYEPKSKLKNSVQAAVAGWPVGTPIRIPVPPAISPQIVVDGWKSRSTGKIRTLLDFKKFWSAPANDYKRVYGPIYDAFGNFEFGATGAATGISLLTLQLAADYVHGGSNDPINQADIASGFSAIKNGGTLSTQSERLVP